MLYIFTLSTHSDIHSPEFYFEKGFFDRFFVSNSLSYNHMEKADFLYFEVEASNGIILIMFRDSSVTFSAKIRKN